MACCGSSGRSSRRQQAEEACQGVRVQGLLYMLATQHTTGEGGESPPVFRDVALMNKSDKLLHEVRRLCRSDGNRNVFGRPDPTRYHHAVVAADVQEIARDLDIPPGWWGPQRHRGLVAHRVFNGRHTIIRNTGNGDVPPHGLHPAGEEQDDD